MLREISQIQDLHFKIGEFKLYQFLRGLNVNISFLWQMVMGYEIAFHCSVSISQHTILLLLLKNDLDFTKSLLGV